MKEGDGQIPEGVYGIEYLNPNSSYYLSMKVSYPNAADRRRAKADGRLLTTYARRHPWNDPKPTGLGEFACVSSDNGKTWDVAHEIRIASCVEDDMGYPSTCELDDGWMLTVYYQSPAPGEKPALMGTKWRLPPNPAKLAGD